jgi:ABC-type Fe3+-siderophore transport system permease subunit
MDTDIFREVCGFFAMMLGTLMDPIATPGYIICGLFIRNLKGALIAAMGWNLILRIVVYALESKNGEPGPDTEVIVASFAGALFATGIVYFIASKKRKQLQAEAANKQQKENSDT